MQPMTRVFSPKEATPWMGVLHKMQHDTYHLPGYHALAEQQGEGQAKLFVYNEGEYCLALPLLLRPIEVVPGLATVGRGWYDATSVYGYAGPIASHSTIPASVLHGFQHALQGYLAEQRVVALFTRLHPLIEQQHLIRGLGEQVLLGRTVSIRLATDEQALLAGYRPTHRAPVRRLQRRGVTAEWDNTGGAVDQFITLYTETMQRVGATDWYYFKPEYFHQLWLLNPGAIHLLLLRLEHTVICGGIFMLCGHIAQYHLGATLTNYLKISPAKLLMHEAALWAARQGAHVLHLGGGVGARETGVFQFKAGFSDQRHDYYTWRWVVKPDVYSLLLHQQQAVSPHAPQDDHHFFPLYRQGT